MEMLGVVDRQRVPRLRKIHDQVAARQRIRVGYGMELQGLLDLLVCSFGWLRDPVPRITPVRTSNVSSIVSYEDPCSTPSIPLPAYLDRVSGQYGNGVVIRKDSLCGLVSHDRELCVSDSIISAQREK